MRRVPRCMEAAVMNESVGGLALLDVAIVALCALEAAVGVMADVATGLSIALLGVGLAAGAVQFVPRFQGTLSRGLAGTAVGLAAASGVLALTLAVRMAACLACLPRCEAAVAAPA